MKKMYKNICIVIVAGIAATGCSRYYYEKGGMHQNNMAYSKAVVYYEKAAKKKKYPMIEKTLADCYRLMNNKEKEEFWYRQIVQSPICEDSDTLNFSRILIDNGKYIEAKYLLNKYLMNKPHDSVAHNLLTTVLSVSSYYSDSASFVVKLLDINSEGASAFGATYYKNGIVFSSEKEDGIRHKKCDWTGRPYLNLYFAKKTSNSTLEKPEKLNGAINKAYHEGPSAFNKKGTEMYFTSGLLTHKNKPDNNKDGVNILRIYKANKVNGEWNNIKEVPLLNNELYSVGHPALSPDDKKLYFISDMEGGYGGTDIYGSIWDNGIWGIPENLGPEINSPGNEMFPFVAEDGTLYFSSNGHGGMGGMDIFSSVTKDEYWKEPVNLGYPINSFADDISFITVRENKKGFFSSNRESAEGIDYLYSFEKPEPVFIVNGIVVDAETRQPLNSMPVTLFKQGQYFQRILTDSSGKFTFSLEKNNDYSVVVRNKFSSYDSKFSTRDKKHSETFFAAMELLNPVFTLKGLVVDKSQNPLRGAKVQWISYYENDMKELYTDEHGNFSFPLEAEKTYLIYGSLQNYLKRSEVASTSGKKNSETIFVRLELDRIVLNKPIRVDNIHYDYNKWTIRHDAESELDKLVKMMQENPDIQIELSSHCDSRGSDMHNLNLSQKRAESAVHYIVSRGVDILRITARGYGETRLLNKCSNNVNCPEEDHQYNRRSEFSITGVNQNILSQIK